MYPTFVVSDVGEAIEKAEQLGGGVKTYVLSFEYMNGLMLISAVPERRFRMVWV